MKPIFRTITSLLLCTLCFVGLCTNVFAENEYVTQTSMVRSLQAMLQTVAPLGTSFDSESEHGGGTGNLGFIQTAFYRLFLTELGKSDLLTESEALTTLSAFAPGDKAQAATLSTAMGALRFGDLIQYGAGGHISLVLGDLSGSLIVYDAGFGGKDNVVRMRQVTKEELETQAIQADAQGGLYFFRAKNTPVFDITLSLMKKPSVTSYFLEAEPTAAGVLLEYYSSQTGKQEVRDDNEQLLFFCNTKEPGTQPMLFLYGSAFALSLADVKNEAVESLSVDATPTKTEYTTEEELDMAGSVISAKMKDGQKRTLTEDEYTVTYAFTAPGPATITVSYGGKSATFAVTVKEPPVVKVTVIPPTKLEYYAGERLDLTGGSILVDYEKQKNVTLPLSESMISAYDTTKAGDLKITVTYGEKTTEFTVKIIENRVFELRLNTPLSKKYRKGSTLDVGSVELTVVYENGQTRTITGADCTVLIGSEESATFRKAGETTVLFQYEGVSTGPSAVEVTENPMDALLRTLIIIGACLIGIPLLIVLIVLIVRRVRSKEEEDPADADVRLAADTAYYDDEDDDMRIFDPEERMKDDTVPLPDIATGRTSTQNPDHGATIRMPVLPTDETTVNPANDATIRLPEIDTKSASSSAIDFFDEI